MSLAREIASLATAAKRIAIILHRNPDGDAIGSAVALKLALKRKVSAIICLEEIADVFTDIVGPIKTAPVTNGCDLIIIVDCAEKHRLSTKQDIAEIRKHGTKIVVIDHHRQGNLKKLADIYFQDSTATATAELVWEVLKELRATITSRLANALLLGLYTDTGGFKHANTTDKCLELASRLVNHGGNLLKISSGLSQKRTIPQMKLWGHAFSELRVSPQGLAVCRIDAETMDNFGANSKDLAGLANVLALTEGVKAVLVLFETKEGWQGTLRSKNLNINLSRLAMLLGGKGSQKAGGFATTGSLISGTISGEALFSIPELSE